MLLRSGRSWAVDLFLRRGWLVKRHKLRRHPSNWQPLSTIPAECLEERILLSTITVTTLADNLTSDGQVTLREAIKAANTDTSVDGSTAGQAGVQNLIVIQPGLTGTISLNAALGQMTITTSLEIQGLGTASTIIDAQHNSRIFNITSAAGDVTLDGLTMKNGTTTADNDAGGAVQSNATGMLTLQNCTLAGNSTAGADSYGGAVFVYGLSTVTNCILTGNSTTGTDAVGGALRGDHDITVTDSSLSGNFTAGMHAYGGAIATPAALTVTNSTLSGNSTIGTSTTGFAASGGAIRCNGPLNITNSTVVGNFTTGAGATGGGIAAVGNTVITNSTIVQNQAVNAADGGIYHDLVDGTTITLINTILAQNTDNGTAPDGDLAAVTAPVTVEYSLIGNNTGTSLAAAPLEAPDGNGNFIGTTGALINPVLGALGYNGGPTQTMALLSDSPAINSGNNLLAVDPTTSAPLATDQRGAPFARIANGTVDMGAYEDQTLALNLVVTSADDTLDAGYNPAHLTLRDAVGLANGNAGPDTITFAAALDGTPIDLTLGQLSITDSVTIIGNGPAETIINAQQNSRVFNVAAGSEDAAFEDLTITGGKTTGSSDSGGGIQFLSSGQLLVENSVLSGNTSTAATGGGIYTNVGTVTILNSTISGNSVVADHKDGGGIFAQNGNVSVTNSTLTGNTTAGVNGFGGAIYAVNGNVVVTNSTITRNATLGVNSEGAGIKTLRGSLTLLNSIVSGNTIHPGSLTPADVKFVNYVGTATFVAQHSLIGVNSGTPLNPAAVGAPDANGNLVGTFANPLDAKLGPLADNGGPTQTIALLLGSPAINAGSNTLAVAPDNSPLTTDQRGTGYPRVDGGTVDMGSYEYQAPAIPLIVTTATDVLDTGGIDPAHLSLRDAVALANASAGLDQITFSNSLAGVPIDLTLGELLITDPVTITGLGAKSTIISAQGNSRVFDVAAAAGDFTLNALTVTGGKTTVNYGDGAGIQFLSSGQLTITNSAISGNMTTGTMGQGAGIFTRSGAVLVVNSTISGNTTSGTHGDGAGIFSQHGTVSLFNSTVSGNYESGYHAGTVAIGTYYAEATITLTDSTVADNIDYGGNSISAAVGSARASIILTNSIIAGNICSKGTAPDVGIGNLSGTATFVAKNSLIGIDNGTPLNPAPIGSPDANGNFSGTFANPLNADLGPLADNGGPTQTMALLLGSPAINGGNNALAVAPDNSPLTTDQRGAGFPRVDGGTVDMGSYEYHLPTIPLIVTTAADVLDTGSIDPAHLSLRDAVAIANASAGPDQITFSNSLAGVPIDLTLGELLITGPVTITGLGAKSTIVDAQGNSRVFDVTPRAGDVALNGLTVTGGKTTADNGYGAGIQFLSSGHLTITGSAITGNQTGGFLARGAGVFTNTGAVTIVDSTLSGNKSTGTGDDGTAIFSQHGAVTLINSTISGNYTSGYHADGVAIYTNYSDAAVTLTDSTVSANTNFGGNTNGAAVSAVRASITLSNSIIAGNIIGTGTSPDLGFENLSHTATFVAKNSLIGVNSGTPLSPAPAGSPDANGNLVGTFASPLSPKLGPLADNGGPTQTMALLAGSPALGTGAIFHVAGDNPIPTDQRGEPRIAGAVDMGAYQSPTIAGINRSNPATSPTTASSVTFVVTFNEPVLNVTTGDFTVNAGSVNTVTPIGSTIFDVTVSGLNSFTGTLTLGLSAGQTITDAGGGRLLNTTPTGADVNTYFIDHTPPVFTSLANATFTVGTPGTFTVTASGFFAAALTESNTDVLPSGVKFNAATGVLSGTPAAGTAGLYTLHFTANDGLFPGVNQTFTLTVNQPLDLSGVWLVTSPAGVAQGLGRISTSGAALTIVNSTGASTTGSLSGTNRITAASLDGNANATGTIDTSTADNGRITWSDGFVWARVSLGGQWAVTSGSTTTLASITQSGNQATLTSGATTTVTTIVYNSTQSQLQLQLANNSTIALVNDSFTLNGQVWNKLDLPTNYTTSFGGGAVSVVQNGTTSLMLVNSQGQKSPGFWLSPTQLVATAFGNEIGTLANGAITWSTGEVWTENVVLNGTRNGASGASSIAAAPSIAVLPNQYTILSYVNSANASLKQYLIQNGTNTALFINDAGQMATGTFINSTQYNIAAWGVTATIAAGEISFSSGLSWTQTVLASTAPVVITSYVNVGDTGRRYLVQNGTSQVALLNTTVNLGTFTNATTFTVPAVGLTATFSSGKISFTNGSSWMQTDFGSSLPVTVASYVSSANSSLQEFFIQNGTSNALFINDAGQMALGTYVNPTQINIAAWGLTATIGAGQITFSNGTAWTLSFLRSSPVTITSYANQSDSGARYLVQNGTSQLAILNANMVLGTFTSATQFNVPAAGITGTIGAGQISFSNNSSWLQTSPVASSVTADYYVSPTNGNQGEVYTNGSTVLFIKSDGARAFATLISGTTYNIAAWSLQATFSPGKVTFNNGSSWTQTNAPLPTVTFTDTNGATFKIQMLTRTTFIALSGNLTGMTGTRQDDRLTWPNGTVWNNFDFNAVNALFQMGTGYP
jgi:CSLREA domain-containing protein